MGDVDRPFSCSDCSKSFTRSENLERHRRARHGAAGRKNFECARCLARFSRSDVYKRHSNRCRAPAPAPAPQKQQHQQPVEDLGTASELPGVQAFSASPQSVASGETITTHIKAYFENFHPSLPILHRPTFTVSSTPKELLNITAVIGSLYSHDPDEEESCKRWRRDVWEDGRKTLQQLVSADCSEIRKTWVMQAWLLHIIYGAYMSDTTGQFAKAKNMLQMLVDATRELGLLRQDIAMPGFLSWMIRDHSNVLQDDSQTFYTRWMSYINEESMKLFVYTLVFLDSQISSHCNSRPLLSSMELSWELPFPSNLWEANNSQIWLQRFTDHFGFSSLSTADNYLYGLRGIATASLSIATQQLMTETPNPELLATLAASPLATLYVLTNLGALIRDFTKCYYQLPPSLSDPSAFHILTQSQNKQIHNALQIISRIVKDQAYTNESPQYLLWRTIELFACSIKVALCRPDHLLIGGIVDNSLIASMATSTHLTLGSYVAERRSVPSLSHQLRGDDGIVAILHDLTTAASNISRANLGCAAREAPWVTTASYGIFLCIWGGLRRVITDIRQQVDTFSELPRTSESCMLIFNSLMELVMLNLNVENDMAVARDPRLWSADRDAFCSLLDEAESLIIALMRQVCKCRPTWNIGPSMVTILAEIAPDTHPVAGG